MTREKGKSLESERGKKEEWFVFCESEGVPRVRVIQVMITPPSLEVESLE